MDECRAPIPNTSLLHPPIKQDGTLKKKSVFSIDSEFQTKRFWMIEILEVRLLFWKRWFKVKMDFINRFRLHGKSKKAKHLWYA